MMKCIKCKMNIPKNAGILVSDLNKKQEYICHNCLAILPHQ